MGTEVGRIEKEFVFKALIDEAAPCDVHGERREARFRFGAVTDERLDLVPLEGEVGGFQPGEEVRVFFYLKNNYHAFTARVLEAGQSKLVLQHPPGVYKNLQRKYERVRMKGELEVSFNIKGTRVELNFPKSDRFIPPEPPETSGTFDTGRIQTLVQAFRTKMTPLSSQNKIVMLRDKVPRTWEEQVIIRLGKCLWVQSTAEDFPSKDPFPDDRVITKGDLVKLEEESGAQPYVITGKLGNILYEKTKKEITSELWCPVLYNEYAVGYLRVWNTTDRTDRIGKDIVEYCWQFAKVLSYSLVANGYFKAENATERRYEAPIIDMSASGLLFAHTSTDLVRDLLVHTDLDLSMKIDKRAFRVGARIMRKFRDAENAYFGVLFLKIEPEDFQFLFQHLYGKPFDSQYEGIWEGGAPPPPVVL
ncbi:MAG TPA: PilZ domain-containing protein [Spirochaetia bacterium]|nr:PilZ domain-containing protein [Spirochaetia bacterium]